MFPNRSTDTFLLMMNSNGRRDIAMLSENRGFYNGLSSIGFIHSIINLQKFSVSGHKYYCVKNRANSERTKSSVKELYALNHLSESHLDEICQFMNTSDCSAGLIIAFGSTQKSISVAC